MKEYLHIIPVREAFASGDECPFCYLRRLSEQRLLRQVAGPAASYMEPQMRAVTDETGFCPEHMKKLYDYGNALGSALMLQTYCARLIGQLRSEIETFRQPQPRKLFAKPVESTTGLWKNMQEEVDRCYICEQLDDSMDRYYRTFFVLIKEAEFRGCVENSKGFCLQHFGELLHRAELLLPNGQRQWFYDTVFSLMEDNLVRVKEDLDWMIMKYDYRNAGAPWKASRDALQRTMQKLGGGYVADKPYREE